MEKTLKTMAGLGGLALILPAVGRFGWQLGVGLAAPGRTAQRLRR